MSFLQKIAVGLAIADHVVEVVELTFDGKPKIRARGRVDIEQGVVVRGRIQDQKKLADFVKKAFDAASPTPIKRGAVVVGLPEPQTYIYIFKTAAKTDDIVAAEIASNIPIDKDDLTYAWRVMNEAEGMRHILAVAASRKAVEEWRVFFESLGLEVDFFDIEVLAIFRNVFREFPKEPVCILDIGAATTAISIFADHGLAYTRSVYIAGAHITQDIAISLKISVSDAETKKKSVGLGDHGEPIFFALVRALEPIVRETRGAIEHFARTSGRYVTELVLVGGSSRMPGLDEYLATNLGIPVKVAGAPETEVEAVGFALRALENRWSKLDPAIPASFTASTPHSFWGVFGR